MNIELRKHIAKVLIEWRAYVKAMGIGFIVPETDLDLTCNSGICANVLDNTPDDLFEEMDAELKMMFQEDGLDVEFPFNGSAHDYCVEQYGFAMHLNYHRMTWVDKIIEAYGTTTNKDKL